MGRRRAPRARGARHQRDRSPAPRAAERSGGRHRRPRGAPAGRRLLRDRRRRRVLHASVPVSRRDALLAACRRPRQRAGDGWAARGLDIERPSAAGSSTTEVLAIYPSVELLPVNQLRLYVHFSAPMSEDWAARAVHVHRADDGETLAGAFLEGPELWDGERRRLTLLLDPRRIKRGLVPNQESGYPLIEGVPVVVRIRCGVPRRRRLADSSHRRAALRGGAGRADAVDPARWRCEAPVAGSTDALRVQFERPLDHGLIERCLGSSTLQASGSPDARPCCRANGSGASSLRHRGPPAGTRS